MRKYVKQWDGKVETTTIETPSKSTAALEGGLLADEEAARMAKGEKLTATVHSILLTPDMKRSVLYGGQTMFAVKEPTMEAKLKRQRKNLIKLKQQRISSPEDVQPSGILENTLT